MTAEKAMTDAGIPMGEGLSRSVAQFFFEIGYGACFAEVTVRNDCKPPFDLADEHVEQAFQRSIEDYEDGADMDRYLAFADTPPPAAAGDRALAEALDRQCDNMSFILNRLELPAQWLAKFERELAEDRTLLKALRTPEPNSGGEGWQDISTAPKDGTLILVCDTSAREPEAGEAQWSSEQWRCFDFDYGVEGSWPNPTHWRPLPDAPATAKASA